MAERKHLHVKKNSKSIIVSGGNQSQLQKITMQEKLIYEHLKLMQKEMQSEKLLIDEITSLRLDIASLVVKQNQLTAKHLKNFKDLKKRQTSFLKLYERLRALYNYEFIYEHE